MWPLYITIMKVRQYLGICRWITHWCCDEDLHHVPVRKDDKTCAALHIITSKSQAIPDPCRWLAHWCCGRLWWGCAPHNGAAGWLSVCSAPQSSVSGTLWAAYLFYETRTFKRTTINLLNKRLLLDPTWEIKLKVQLATWWMLYFCNSNIDIVVIIEHVLNNGIK